MARAKHILSATLLTGIALAGFGGGLQAAESDITKSMKPLEGVFFDTGTKHAVGYFYNEDGKCKLVLTVADAPSQDAVQTFAPIRHEANVPAGKSERYSLTEGQTFEFKCGNTLAGMTATKIQDVASNPTN